MRDHGVDPGDWSAVYAVLLASPGYVSALDRAKALALRADTALMADERRAATGHGCHDVGHDGDAP